MTYFPSLRRNYIDWRLAVHGEVSRPDIARTFGVSLSIATQDIQAYIREHPDAIEYDATERRYVPVSGHRATSAIAKAIIDRHSNPLGWT